MAHQYNTTGKIGQWEELVSRYRQREGLTPTPEQLEREIAKVDAIPLSEDEIKSIVSTVSSGDVGT